MAHMKTIETFYDNDYKSIDGVEFGTFEYGPDRELDASEPTTPRNGVAMFVTSPSHKEVVVAAGTIGYEPSDMVIVVWQSTLCGTDGQKVIPKNGDWLERCNGERWRIRSRKKIMDGAQWRCLCRETVLSIT